MSTPISARKALYEWRLYLMIAPAVVLVGLFAYWPALSAAYHSFFDWQGGDAEQFVGLDNFRRAFTDGVLWKSFIVVVILAAANIIKMIPSIALAVVIHRLISDR